MANPVDPMVVLGGIGALVAIVGGVQAIGNRSMSKTMDAKLGAPLARQDEKLTALTKSLDEHKVATTLQHQAKQLALESIRHDVNDLQGRMSVVEDRSKRVGAA